MNLGILLRNWMDVSYCTKYRVLFNSLTILFFFFSKRAKDLIWCHSPSLYIYFHQIKCPIERKKQRKSYTPPYGVLSFVYLLHWTGIISKYVNFIEIDGKQRFQWMMMIIFHSLAHSLIFWNKLHRTLCAVQIDIYVPKSVDRSTNSPNAEVLFFSPTTN